MKILIVNTYDGGGAANACLRLHQGLLQEGMDSSVLLRTKRKSIPETYQFGTQRVSNSNLKIVKNKLKSLMGNGISKEQLFLKKRPKGLEIFSFPKTNFDITASPLYEEADVINLHWVANFLDYESFFKKNKKPVVWTLHDMNPFTGGEHYDQSVLGMNESGYPIPRLLTEEEKQMFQENLVLKKRAIESVKNLTIVSPSKWLAQEAKQSSVFKTREVLCIPYGIDSTVFKPIDKDFSRDVLGIPKDKKVVLFVADSISNDRKGYSYLKNALSMMQRKDVVLCAIGSKKGAIEANEQILELGAIADDRLMNIAYSAADVFVIPSLMDNLPNTVIESLMSGTPVIGFPIGGIPDMIEHGVNGLLAEDISSTALLKSIEEFLNTSDTFNRFEIGTSAKKRYDLPIQAKAYINLYKSVL